MVPAASTIKLFVASAFWRSGLDPAEPVVVPAVSWSPTPCLGRLRSSSAGVSDNAATNVLLEYLGFDAVNEEAVRLGCERTEVRRLMISDGPQNLMRP